MLRNQRTKISVSPWTAVLLALFISFTSPVVLAALLLASLCHEWGHYGVLRFVGAVVEEIRISVFGAEIRVAERPQLSYGREMLAVMAGPAVNIGLALLFSCCGRWGECLYLFSGAQLILGGFNLLPMRPLDGGTMLWLALAWGMDPIAAERSMRWVEGIMTALLLLFSLWMWWESGRPFLCLSVIGLCKPFWPEKKLVKSGKRR